MGLPVLRLPSLVFDNVYRSLDVPDIIVFSQCSRNMKAIVKSKEGPEKRYYLGVRIGANETCVKLQQLENWSLISLFSWTLCTNEKPVWDADKVISNDGARIGAAELTMREKENEWRSIVKKDYYEKKILAIVKLFKDIFHCEIEEVTLDSDAGDSFRKLFIETDELHVADTTALYHDTCTPEEMIFILDHFDTYFLTVRPDCGPDFSYSKPLKEYLTLTLCYSRWIDFSRLLTLAKNAQTLNLINADMITDKDINQFIKWWLESDTEDLEMVFINKSYTDRAAVMEGIPTTPARRKHWKEIPLFDDFILDVWYDMGLDIRRKDGVEATIIMRWSWFALGVMQKIEEATDN